MLSQSLPTHPVLPDGSSVGDDAYFTTIVEALSGNCAVELAEGTSPEARLADQQRAARLADPELMSAAGDGSIFKPFRFPTKISEAFRLPWSDIGVVSDRQLESFYNGTQMRGTPKRVIGA